MDTENTVNNSANASETVKPVFPTTPPFVPTYTQYNPKPLKREITFQKKDKVFMGLLILSAVLTVFFGLFGGFSLGLTLSVWILTLVTAIYLKDNGDFSLLSVSALAGTLISSLSFTFYGFDGSNSFIAVILTVICYSVFAVSMCDDEIFDSFRGLLKYGFVSAVSPYINIAVPIKAGVGKDKDRRKSAIQVFAAILVSVPVLCVVTALLVNSDAAFEGLMSYAAEKIGMTVLKLFIALLISAFLMAFVVTNRFDMFDKNSILLGAPKRPLKSLFTVTLLSLLSAVYLAFLFSQLAYFVNSFKGLLPEGFTFADYARRGFFETESVAFINLVIIALLMQFTKKNENDELPAISKGLMAFVSAFSVFFIITAIAKMIMYINKYGLTSLRVFTSVFMIATCAFIVAFAVRVFNAEASTIKYAIAFSLVIFALLPTIGIDRTVASYNVNAYLSGKHEKIDIEYLYRLGDEAVPYIAKLKESSDKEVADKANEAIEYLFKIKLMYSEESGEYMFENGVITKKYHKDWRFNLTDYRISKMYENEKIVYDGTEELRYPFSLDDEIWYG